MSVGIINGVGNAWGQIKKTVTDVVDGVTATGASGGTTTEATAAPTSTPTLAPTPAPTPGTTESHAPGGGSASAAPLTYSTPSATQFANATPTARFALAEELGRAGYYTAPQTATVADPMTPPVEEAQAALSTSQIIAQNAYALVAQAGEDQRLSLIQQA